MSDETKPGDEVFTDEDLTPSPGEGRIQLGLVIDKVATAVATMVLGGWAGGLVVLHYGTTPWVLELTPPPLGGRVLAAILTSFDGMALGCGAIALGCEVVRTAMAARRRPTVTTRIRRYLAIFLAAAMAYIGLVLTPKIVPLAQLGVAPKVGPDGFELARLYDQAELIGLATVPLAAVLIALHIFTLRSGTAPGDEPAAAPLPPGPATQS